VPVGEARPRHVWVEAVSLEEEVQKSTEGVLVERVVQARQQAKRHEDVGLVGLSEPNRQGKTMYEDMA
jgi:hypothetical protein